MARSLTEQFMLEVKSRNLALHVSAVSIAINLLLFLFKIAAGIMDHSSAMVSDAFHSGSDVLSTVIVIWGIVLSSRKSDPAHPYGYDRLECVTAMVLAGLLTVTAVAAGVEGTEKIFDASATRTVPGMLALSAAAVSIVVKEWMYWYTRKASKKTRSSALLADAWHHRSDAMSSIGAFIGIFGARLGFPFLDPLASIVIACFILKIALDIFQDAVGKIVDHACPAETERAMRTLILHERGVLSLHYLRTRLFASKIFVEIEIAADGSLTLRESQAIARRIRVQLISHFPDVRRCMIAIVPDIPDTPKHSPIDALFPEDPNENEALSR